jgi:hypothetical protein
LHVEATVTDVMPVIGLAYLAGDDGNDWTVTRSTPGYGLEALKPGAHVDLTVRQHRHFAFVSAYAAMD